MTVSPGTEPATAPMPSSVEAHRPAIWRYLRALGANRGEADDLCQETMVVGCTTTLANDPAAARAFLRGVAKNQWLRSRRWWQRRREREIAIAVDELWDATADDDGGDELVERLGACLESLQPRARTALDLHYRDGLDWRAVASRIGLSANGTKTLVQRARQALRTCIERRQA